MFRRGMRNMFLITGTVMGAGYASGREIWQFFGPGSGLAIMIFTVLFIFCTTTLLNISYKNKTTNYLPVLEKLTSKRIAHIYDYMILVYLFCVTVVMIAGSGATFETFGLPFWSGILFIFIGLIIIFSRGINEMLNINQVLMPLLIIALIFVLIAFIHDENISLLDKWQYQSNWTAAFPFTSLNVLPLVAVLGAIGNRIESKGEIYISTIMSGGILGMITLLYNRSLVHVAGEINLPSIPLFTIINNYHTGIMIMMMIMLWIAIYTTAAATLLGMVTRINNRYNLPLVKIAFFALLLMIPFSGIGFSQLVAIIYPLYGFLNLYLFMKLIVYPIWNKNR
mgnify:CR=1 FL=1